MPAVDKKFDLKHLLAIEDLQESQIRYILGLAKLFKNKEPDPFLKGKTVVNLFFENSTRTKISFEVAAKKLGGNAIGFAASTSSVSKGETLLDTARNIMAMQGDCLVVRHESAGSPYRLSQEVSIPVINAGDGFHEHPTQALLDAFTMEEKLGTLKNKRILIIGDIAHSRVARSNIYCLQKLGAKVAVCGPPTLLPPQVEKLNVEFAYRPEKLLPQADVVMALRIQTERQNQMQLPSLTEYRRFWGMDRERFNLMKPEAFILHPGPVNRGVELDPEIADDPRSVILDQVTNGVLVRMAILALLCAPKETQDWAQKDGLHV